MWRSGKIRDVASSISEVTELKKDVEQTIGHLETEGFALLI